MARDDSAVARVRATLASLLFLVVVPGTVAGLLPWLITRWRAEAVAAAWPVRPLGIGLVAAGAVVLLEAFARFAWQGLGTPAPIYPTGRLVVGGTYRHVRNPMYLAVLAIILGQAAMFGSSILLAYCAAVAVAFHLFVVLYEEPTLRRSFPDDYRRYAAHVRRWLPRLTPWVGGALR